MKRAFVFLLAAMVVAGLWYVLRDRGELEGDAAAGNSESKRVATAQPSLERVESAESLAAPAESARSEADVTPSPEPELLTIRGFVRDQLDGPVEHFGLRGVRRDANNLFAEERRWPAEFHPGGEFTLSNLEPYVWEIAPVAEGFTFERSQRFARSNERPVKFRMLCKVRVTGIVLDSEGAPVAQASIRATSLKLPSSIFATTDSAGAFELELEPGKYGLIAAHDLRGVSDPQSIELAPLQRPVDLEFRLAPSGQIRVCFPPSWRRAAVLVLPLSTGNVETFSQAKTNDECAVVRGLLPGWKRLVVATPDDRSTAYMAAVELVSIDQVLELNFEVATPTRVTLRLRASTDDAESRDLRLDYELLPTLPNLTWLEVKRDVGDGGRKGLDPKWMLNSDWSACAPGSYVAVPRSRAGSEPPALVRFEVPNAVEFEVVLPRAR